MELVVQIYKTTQSKTQFLIKGSHFTCYIARAFHSGLQHVRRNTKCTSRNVRFTDRARDVIGQYEKWVVWTNIKPLSSENFVDCPVMPVNFDHGYRIEHG